ncbi:MAG: LamG domain-containing protein, partial [Pseudomonadales bacterium]|nr:LamG domain-containing protein [Pseudomonadales bacterium]
MRKTRKHKRLKTTEKYKGLLALSLAFSPVVAFSASDLMYYYPVAGNFIDASDRGATDMQGNPLNGIPVGPGVNFLNDPQRGPLAEVKGDTFISLKQGEAEELQLPSREITLAGWVQVDTPLTWGGFVSFFQDNGNNEAGWVLGTRGRKFSIALASEETKSLTYLEAPNDYELGQFYHVAATYDGANMTLYVDGIPVSTSQDQSGDIYYPSTSNGPGWAEYGNSDFAIGSYLDFNEDFRHTGLLDDIAIWDRALAATEINTLYHKGLEPYQGTSFAFSGTPGEYALLDQKSVVSFGPDDDFSLEVRVKSNGWTGDPSIFSNKDWASGGNAGFIIAARSDGSGWKVNLGDGSNRVDANGGVIADGRWHQLTVTVDRDGDMTLYQNGQRLSSVPVSAIGDLNTQLNVALGQDGTLEYSPGFTGAIAEVRVWNKVLDQQTIQNYSVQSVNSDHPAYDSLAGHWKFNEGSGNTAASSTDYTSKFTLAGGEWSINPNRTPFATDDHMLVYAGETISIPATGVLSNDTDPDGDRVQVVTVNGMAAKVGNPITLSNGAIVTITSDGAITIKANSNSSGAANLTYSIQDEHGASSSAKVNVDVAGSELIAPYLQNPSSDAIYVTWKTRTSEESVVHYGTSPGQLNQVASGDYENLGTFYNFHTVKINNLTPDTPYYYQVVSRNQTSAVHRFRTQPKEGSNEGIYRFLVIGDHQVQADKRYMELVQAAKAKVLEKYDHEGTGHVEDYVRLMINLGDQVDVGSLEQYEKLHFQQSAPLASNIAFMTAVGNHEYSGDPSLSRYKSHFILDDAEQTYLGNVGLGSGNEEYYAFQVANIVFIMMNSNTRIQEQLDWVKQVKDAADSDSNVEWLFGAAHHPILAEELPGDASSYMAQGAVPELATSDKTAVYFSGHAHLYARGALRNHPVHHVINGGASWDQYWEQNRSDDVDYPDVQKTLENHVFQIVEINMDKREMFVQTWSPGNSNYRYPEYQSKQEVHLIDEFYRKFDAPGPEQPLITNLNASQITLPFTFEGSAYLGQEPINSSEFQISGNDGSFSDPKITVKRDIENLFGSTGSNGSPEPFTPIDRNAGIDITKLEVSEDELFAGENSIRLRYRDQNLNWSDWSTPHPFVALNGKQPPQTHPVFHYPLNRVDDQSLVNSRFDGGSTFIGDVIRGPVADHNASGMIILHEGIPEESGLPTEQLTVSAWVRVQSAKDWGGIVGYFQDNGNYEKGWLLGTRGEHFSMALSSDGSLTYLTDPADLSLNEWHHVAGVYNGSELSIYVNGVRKNTTTNESGNIDYPDQGWYQIGSYKDDNEDFRHDGQIDNVSIFARALSDAEIARLASAKVP